MAARVIHKTYSRPKQKMMGNGMDLEYLEELIKMALGGVTAEERYATRQNPVKVEFVYNYTNRFVITEAKIKDNTMVLTIDPEF